MNLEVLRSAMNRLEKDGFLKNPKKLLKVTRYRHYSETQYKTDRKGNDGKKAYYVSGVCFYMFATVIKELDISIPIIHEPRYDLKDKNRDIIEEKVKEIEHVFDIASSFR